jgi:hypothetical protein
MRSFPAASTAAPGNSLQSDGKSAGRACRTTAIGGDEAETGRIWCTRSGDASPAGLRRLDGREAVRDPASDLAVLTVGCSRRASLSRCELSVVGC